MRQGAQTLRILHISDFHLPKERGQILHNLDPYEQVQAAMVAVARVFPVPGLAVVGGDMLNAGGWVAMRYSAMSLRC